MRKICSLPIEVKQREKIEIDVGSLIDAATEMKTILPEDHCVNILKNNFIKEVNGGKVNWQQNWKLIKLLT